VRKRNSILTVDLEAIAQNLSVLKQYCGAGIEQMAVVKANAYGHGAVEVARKLDPLVAWFAVNDVGEGIELREHGIENPILVFGVAEAETAALYNRHDLTATVSATEHFKRLPSGTDYHLNFDTGMGRLGFRPEQANAVLKLKSDHPELNCTGIYSHFATADEPDSSRPGQQLRQFKEIRAKFPESLTTHITNTAGIVQRPDAQFNIVRTGIGLYGYAPGQTAIPQLQPAISWSTRLVQINRIKKGETVSYGAIWEAPKDGLIGIIPVGYADAVPRGLSGQMEVMIQGECYPVAGRVTMNYCMVWLGEQRFETGTEVQLWNEEITPLHWADRLGTIPYEILTSLEGDISRHYVHQE
jgi:alanine racemase